MTKERGKWVKRSTFQKVCEDNKKLHIVIKTLILHSDTKEGQLLIEKYTELYRAEKQFNSIMKDIAVEYFRKNPDKQLPSMKNDPRFKTTQP